MEVEGVVVAGIAVVGGCVWCGIEAAEEYSGKDEHC